VTAEVNIGNRMGARGLRLINEVPERAAQRILIKVSRTRDIESGGLQRLRDQARVVGRGGKRSCLIGPRCRSPARCAFRALAHERNTPAQAR